jgi:hypothetical protein
VDTGSYMDFLTRVDPTGSTADVTGNILSDNISYIHTMAYILIGVGAFVFVVGFMGCCGAIKQWRPLLVGVSVFHVVVSHIGCSGFDRSQTFHKHRDESSY